VIGQHGEHEEHDAADCPPVVREIDSAHATSGGAMMKSAQ
jgi:hypothetical protein